MVFWPHGWTRAETKIRVAGAFLKQVDEFKYLGFFMASNLSPVVHVARALERAKAAAVQIAKHLKKLKLTDTSRIGIYYRAYVDSQFYGVELLPPSVVEAMKTARSVFVRNLFDMPQSTNNELVQILFDVPPPEVVCLSRLKSFRSSIVAHEFSYVQEAIEVDQKLYLNDIRSWHYNALSFLKMANPNLSTVDIDFAKVFEETVIMFKPLSYFNFAYLQGSSSDTTSFYRIFDSCEVLQSFRFVLSSLKYEQGRLLVLFTSSYLRWKFGKKGQEECPFCRKSWNWEHFFLCKFMTFSFGDARLIFPFIRGLICEGQWSLFFEYLQVVLLAWHDALENPIIFADTISKLFVPL